MPKVTNKNRIFNYNLIKRIEADYGRDLYNVSVEINKIITTFISKLDIGEENIKIKDVNDLIDSLNNYSKKIQGWAEKTASRMVHTLENQDLKQWAEHSDKMSSLMKSEMKRSDVNKLLQQYMDENVKLITSLPESAAKRVNKLVYENLTTGKRASTVAKEIMETGNVTQSRANLIARTETSRIVTGLVKARSESVNLNWFVWKVTHDNKLRASHKHMDNVLVRWDDPPSPEKLIGKKSYGEYLPGATFNCRCYPAPLIRLEDVSWPAIVYRKGIISKMAKQQFLRLEDIKYYKKAA